MTRLAAAARAPGCAAMLALWVVAIAPAQPPATRVAPGPQPPMLTAPLHQQGDVPFLLRRRIEIEQLAAERDDGAVLGMMRELPDLFAGARPEPDVKTCGEVLAQARARLLRCARDADARVREPLFLFAYPELADPVQDAAVHLTVRALWRVAATEPLTVRLRIRDASGRVVAERALDGPVDGDGLSGYHTTQAFPLAGLPDGAYVGEAIVAVGGRPPRPTDVAVASRFFVRRGARARIAEIMRGRGALAARLSGSDAVGAARSTSEQAAARPADLAAVDVLILELSRAFEIGVPYPFATDLDAVLAEAERRLAALAADQPLFSAPAGEITLGLRSATGGLFPYRLFVPATPPPPAGWPVVVFAPDVHVIAAQMTELAGRGALLAAAQRRGAVLVALASLSLAEEPGTLARVLADTGRLVPLDKSRIVGCGHGAGAAQMLAETRARPGLFHRLVLLAPGWLTEDDLRALRDVDLTVVQSSLSPQIEYWSQLPARIAAAGHRQATFVVADGIPNAMLPGRWLRRVIEQS